MAFLRPVRARGANRRGLPLPFLSGWEVSVSRHSHLVVLGHLHLPFWPWGSFSRSLPPPPAQRHSLSPTDSCFPGGCALEEVGGENKTTKEEQGGVSPPFAISLLQPLSPAPLLPLCTAASPSQITGLFPPPLHKGGCI